VTGTLCCTLGFDNVSVCGKRGRNGADMAVNGRLISVITGSAAVVAMAALACSGMAFAAAAPTPTIRTIAGGVGGPGPATSIAIAQPCGLAAAGGSLYVGEVSSGLVRNVNTASGWMTTVAGDGVAGASRSGSLATATGLAGPCGMAKDQAGNLIVAQTDRISVVAARSGYFYGQHMTRGHLYTIAGTGPKGATGDGGLAVKARVQSFFQIAVDPAGNILFADQLDHRVRIIAARSNTRYGLHMTALHIYSLDPKAIVGAQGLAVDHAGNVVICANDDEVKVLAVKTGTFYQRHMTAGQLYTVAGTGATGWTGDGGPATKATLNGPVSVAIGPAGNLVIADSGNDIARVVAERAGTFYGVPMTAGDIYAVPSEAPLVDYADAVAVDNAGNILLANYEDEVVIAIPATAGTYYGQAMTVGKAYVVAGNGTEYGFGGCFGGYAGNAVAANRAEFGCPEGLAVDAAGNIVGADTGSNRVRVVAAASGTFYGQAMTRGDVYTVAGTGNFGNPKNGEPATSASMTPVAVAVDGSGNLIVANGYNRSVWVVADSTGTFYGQQMTAG
jgi:hypothetical protein